MDNSNRIISLDILRIVAMFFIVIGHIIIHGTIRNDLAFMTFNYFIIWGLLAFCIVSVNCYVLISGYFLCSQKKLKKTKIISLVKKTFFYSVAIFFILLFTKQTTFNIFLMPKVFFPILTFSYWFITIYILMYLFFPYYNLVVNNLTKYKFKVLLIIGFFILSVFPMIFILYIPKLSGISFLMWFTYLYFVGSYIKKYYKPSFKPIKYLLGYICCCLAIVFSKIFFTIITIKLNQNLGTAFLYGNNSFLVFFASLFLFMFFLNLKIQPQKNLISRFIILLSSVTLSVYLITEQFAMRNFLWKKLFALSKDLNCFLLLMKIIIIAMIVYFFSSLVEIIRINILRKLIK